MFGIGKKKFTTFRYRNAFRFGRYEHNISCFLFVMLLITILFHYLHRYNTVLYLLVTDIILWLLYWLSHRMEKLLHPKH